MQLRNISSRTCGGLSKIMVNISMIVRTVMNGMWFPKLSLPKSPHPTPSITNTFVVVITNVIRNDTPEFRTLQLSNV